MPRKRSSVLKSLVSGFLAAVIFTLIAMLALAALLVKLHFSDRTITLANQLIKLGAIITGVCFAVPRGSCRGFATGLEIALLYTVIGYAMYAALGGAGFDFAGMLGELLVGCAAGAVTGAVRANLPAKHRHIRAGV